MGIISRTLILGIMAFMMTMPLCVCGEKIKTDDSHCDHICFSDVTHHSECPCTDTRDCELDQRFIYYSNSSKKSLLIDIKQVNDFITVTHQSIPSHFRVKNSINLRGTSPHYPSEDRQREFLCIFRL